MVKSYELKLHNAALNVLNNYKTIFKKSHYYVEHIGGYIKLKSYRKSYKIYYTPNTIITFPSEILKGFSLCEL